MAGYTDIKTATPVRRIRKAPAPKPHLELTTKRFVVVSPQGRVFLICSGCRHWVQRLLVIECPCCMMHAGNPNAAQNAAESENNNGE